MGDTLVLHSLIATPSFHKHTNTWHGGVVFQRSYHQAVWELGHLKEERKNVTQNTQLSHRNKTSGTLQLKMTPAIRKILQKLTKHSRSVFFGRKYHDNQLWVRFPLCFVRFESSTYLGILGRKRCAFGRFQTWEGFSQTTAPPGSCVATFLQEGDTVIKDNDSLAAKIRTGSYYWIIATIPYISCCFKLCVNTKLAES